MYKRINKSPVPLFICPRCAPGRLRLKLPDEPLLHRFPELFPYSLTCRVQRKVKLKKADYVNLPAEINQMEVCFMIILRGSALK